MLTTASHISLSQATRIQSTPSKPFSLRPSLISSLYLCLGVSRSLISPGSHHKTLCMFHPSLMGATCPIKRAKIWSSSLRNFFQPPVTSSCLHPSILLNFKPVFYHELTLIVGPHFTSINLNNFSINNTTSLYQVYWLSDEKCRYLWPETGKGVSNNNDNNNGNNCNAIKKAHLSLCLSTIPRHKGKVELKFHAHLLSVMDTGKSPGNIAN